MLTFAKFLIFGIFLGNSTLNSNISRMAWSILVIHISFFRIFTALSYETTLEGHSNKKNAQTVYPKALIQGNMRPTCKTFAVDL